MNPLLPAAAAQEYLRQREALLNAFPELADDEAALRDTLEGITTAPDLIALFIRQALEDEAMESALERRIKDMTERKHRLNMRARRHRGSAFKLMEACELRKIELPDFSASLRAIPPSVVIDDEAALPDSLCKLVRQPDKAAIRTALGQAPVPGAHLTNGGSTLSVRTK